MTNLKCFQFYRGEGLLKYYFFTALFLYLIWCDVKFHRQIKSETFVQSNMTTLVSKYTVKYRIISHLSRYVYYPFCIWAENVFSVSYWPGISADLITFLHFVCALISGRLFASNDLSVRQYGCLVFSFGTLLDCLDGIVYRAQKKANPSNLVSGWGTIGFWIDGLTDTTCGIFILLGTSRYVWNNPPIRKSKTLLKSALDAIYEWCRRCLNKILKKPSHIKDEYLGKEIDSVIAVDVHHSKFHTLVFLWLFGINVGIRALLWDHYNKYFHMLLEARRPDVSPENQFTMLNGHTWFIFWLWTWNSADSYMNHSLIFLYFNKTWEWVQFSTYMALPSLGILVLLSQYYLNSMKDELGVTSIL